MFYYPYDFNQLEVGHNIFDYEKSYINLFLDYIYIFRTFIVIEYTLYHKFYPIGIFVLFGIANQGIILYYIS